MTARDQHKKPSILAKSSIVNNFKCTKHQYILALFLFCLSKLYEVHSLINKKINPCLDMSITEKSHANGPDHSSGVVPFYISLVLHSNFKLSKQFRQEC